MNSTFEGLPEEKKKRIIDAAIEEFAMNGYEKASTNSIVKRAEISKGILFHYFGSKKNLFLYIFDYAVTYLLDKYYVNMNEWPADPFDRLIWLSRLKAKMYFDAPLMYKMAYKAMVNIPAGLEKNMGEKYAMYYSQFMPEFFKGIDTSKLRKDITSEKAVEVIMLCLDGLTNKYLKLFKDKPIEEILNNMEPLMKEFNEYIEILKYGVYEKDSR